ncbi:cytochrome b [Aquamicrobium sp. LC103]|uniref:cytochrome b n=1 Tax=Aquamicrobium sp. LC103 TaxID=1120658 RepID=UPI00063E70C6|nr:cytochrome b [Aquamicrobium sp. LC103]TKT82752.1 cytochrome b [Aquamicrobium sp. LC103]
MMRNSSDGYGLVAIVLHWTIALLFLAQIALGLAMVRIGDQRLAFELIQWHKSFGFLILGLVLVRTGWRLAEAVPRPLPGPAWEQGAAILVHLLLYALMIVLPLTGWALVSVSVLEIPTFAFYLVLVPHLPLGVSEQAEEFWTAAHVYAGYLVMVLIAVHVAAALRHHFILRDHALRRMVRPADHGTIKAE